MSPVVTRKRAGPAVTALLALLGVAVGAPACRSDGPSLTLVFQRLPRAIDAMIVVRLSDASGARFMGMDVPGQGGVSVSYSADGAILIGIDRKLAAARGDQIRLPLTAPSALSLQGRAAVATDGLDMMWVQTVASVHPGQSVMLTFDFGSIFGDGGVPAPDADGATDTGVAPPDGAGVDVAADAPPPDAGPPDLGGGGDGAGDDHQTILPDSGSIPDHCVVAALRPASVGAAVSAPGIGYAAGPRLFGVAWSGTGNIGLFYNAFDATGTLQNPAADVAMPLAAGVVAVGTPRLAGLGDQLALAYGQRDSAGQTQAMLARIAPAGAVVAGPLGASDRVAATQPTEIGAVVVGGAGSGAALGTIAVISRTAVSDFSPAEIDLFTQGSSPLVFGEKQRPAVLASSRTTGLGWIAQGGPAGLFFAGVIGQTPAVGTVQAFTGDTLSAGANFAFTDDADRPVIGTLGATLSVTGAAGAVAMAWTDLQACPGCVVREVFLTVVGPAGGRPSGEIQVSEASSTPKSYPHVVFDGQAIAVAWLEYLSQTSSTVKLRRFSPTLQPLGPPLDVAPGGVSRPLDADIDMVAAGPGDYGIAIAVTNGRQSFSHVTCTAN